MNRNEFGLKEFISYYCLGLIMGFGIEISVDHHTSLGWVIMGAAIIIALVNL